MVKQLKSTQSSALSVADGDPNQLSITFMSVKVQQPTLAKNANTAQVLIREPHSLLKTVKKLSFFERRIYWLVLREMKIIQERDPKQLRPWTEVVFKIHYSEVYNSYSPDVKGLAQLLRSRTLSWDDEDESHTDIVVFPKTRYWEKKGIIELRMDREAIPLFINLSKGYSQFELQMALKLTSEYAQALYPWLAGFAHSGWWRVSIADLRQHVNVEANEYALFADFKRRIVDMALGQINAHSDLEITYKMLKQGRAVVGLEFAIQRKQILIEGEDEAATQRRREEVETDLDRIFAQDMPTLIRLAGHALHDYPSFSLKQQEAILTNQIHLQDFLRAHTYVQRGYATVDRQAYVRESVFQYKKGKYVPKTA